MPLLPPGLSESPPSPAPPEPPPVTAPKSVAPRPAAVAPESLPAAATVEPPAAVTPPGPPLAVAVPPLAVTAPQASPPVFTLRVERQDGSVEVVELAPGDNWVGRAPACAVSIDDPTLSRRHARLVVGDDGVRVVDPGSTNHTYVGEAEVPAGAEVAVALGVPLLFGSVKAVLALAEPRPAKAPEGSS